MNMFKVPSQFFLFLIFIFGSFNLLAATDCTVTPKVNSCDFYLDCMESEYSCETTNNAYITGYGDKYCRLFENNKKRFSRRGKIWIKNVKICLQTELFQNFLGQKIDYEQTAENKCRDITQLAFKSHHSCYVKPKGTYRSGICPLWRDYKSVFRVVKPFRNMRGKYGRETKKQVKQTLKTCMKYWGKRSIGIKSGQRTEALQAMHELDLIIKHLK